MSSVAGDKGRNPDLDGLRGIAALSVALGHCYLQVTGLELWKSHLADFHAMPTDLVVARIVSAFFPSDAAVMLFFALSGHVLWQSFSRKKLGFFRDLPDYAASRLYRLLPLTIVSGLLFGLLSTAPARELAENMLLLSRSMNGVLWSLQVEIVASAVLFALWGLTKGSAWKMLIGLAVSVAVLPFSRTNPTVVFLPAFIMGAGVSLVPPWIWRNTPLLILAVLLLVFTNVVLGHGGLDRCIEMAAAAVLVGAVSQRRLPFLRWRVPLFLGAISYPFYLTHPLGLLAAQTLLDGVSFSSPYPMIAARAALSIPPIILLAWVLHVLIEVPVQHGRPRLRWPVLRLRHRPSNRQGVQNLATAGEARSPAAHRGWFASSDQMHSPGPDSGTEQAASAARSTATPSR